jgi:hypothetical protein
LLPITGKLLLGLFPGMNGETENEGLETENEGLEAVNEVRTRFKKLR